MKNVNAQGFVAWLALLIYDDLEGNGGENKFHFMQRFSRKPNQTQHKLLSGVDCSAKQTKLFTLFFGSVIRCSLKAV